MIKLFRAPAAAVALLAAAVNPGIAQENPRQNPLLVERGERIARTWCIACHLVDEEGQRSALADAPSFAGLAERDDLDEAAITSVLILPHPVMPEFALTPEDVGALLAFIGSKRERNEGEAPPDLPSERASLDPRRVLQGQAIATDHCARCHAIAGAGASPVEDAPPFSTLGRRYPVETLAEALAEGILVSHPTIRMPEFAFSPDQIEAFLAYLRSVQE